MQITTDGLKAYVEAMEQGFGGQVDSAILHNVYVSGTADESRYSPAECVGCDKKGAIGDPNLDHASTSYIERRNLTPK